jgi:hypothetical protein
MITNELIELPKGLPIANDIRWCLRAVSKDAAREPLHALHIEKDCMVCTDGRRLHKCEMEEGLLPEGNFLPVKVNKTTCILKRVDYTYPNWSQVVPAEPGEQVQAVCDNSKYKASIACYWLAQKQACVNHDFIKDVIHDTNETWALHVTDGLCPVVLKSSNKTAVVMPIRPK